MLKRQKEVLQYQLDSEKAVLEQLEKYYKRALKDINDKIKLLQSDELTQSRIYHIQYQKTLKKQVEAALEKLHSDEYTTIQQYLSSCYTDAFIGTMYDLAGQGVTVIAPIDQNAAVKAVLTDSKLKEDLYESLGYDVAKLKKTISAEISRGIASGLTYEDIARNIRNASGVPLARANNIVRTDGHRIQQASTDDARHVAKSKGADVVKQWDSTLDGKTRDTHRELDGQIREVDEPFEVDGKEAQFPGDFGEAEEDCKCRCCALTRARKALDSAELDTMKERAKFFGLDKSKSFEDFKEKYLNATKNLANTTIPLISQEKNGIIDVEIDTFTPCLRDTRTGEIVRTTVSKITSKTALKQYNEKTGWNVNWAKTPKNVDVYALRVQGNDAVQGLVGIKNDPDAQAVYIHWASTAPGNNKQLNNGRQDYEGVGGHLFAIAAQTSIDLGYGGYMHGFAANKKVLEHYIDKLGATYLGMLHPYHFAIDEKAAKKLLEVYSYEWK